MTRHKGRKRLYLGLVVMVAALVMCAGVALGANSRDITVRLDGECKVLVDGSQRTFFNGATGEEVFPLVYDGVTYLPLRAIGELMGKNVDWNESTLTVTLSGSRISAPVSGTRASDRRVRRVSGQLRPDFKIVVDGSARSFADANGRTVYPVLCNGSVYLPLRAIGELMGKTVGWDGSSKTVTLSGGGGGGLVNDADTFGGQTGTSGGQTTGKPGQIIGVEAAKNAALNHAGVSQATFTKAKLDYDNGIQVYEIEFVTGDGREYEYEIAAADGSVLGFNVDYQQQQGTGGSYIGEEAARNVALAKVPGAVAGDIVKFKLDSSDAKYELELVYGNVRHEFEIDAYTGKVLEWESEQVSNVSNVSNVGNTNITTAGGHHGAHHGYNYSQTLCGLCGGYHNGDCPYYDGQHSQVCAYCGGYHNGDCPYYGSGHHSQACPYCGEYHRGHCAYSYQS